jgi:N-alpha-acetyltransferase 15/16, NatA auxiliary subunit
MSSSSSSQRLPSREDGYLKEIARCYERKSYRRCLLLSDKILKSYPKHGETLAMKGLVLGCMNRRTESLKYAKLGIVNDIKNGVVWHLQGLLFKTLRQWNDAMKSFQMAQKLDPENDQIMRDTASTQVQCQHFDGYEESRRLMLVQKPHNRNYWIAYAVACYMAKHYDRALEMLQSYQDSIPEQQKYLEMERVSYQTSEVHIFKARVLIDSGDDTKALEHLLHVKKRVRDSLTWMELIAPLFAKMGKTEKAEKYYRKLIKLHPDHIGHLLSLQNLYAVKHGIQPVPVPDVDVDVDADADADAKAKTKTELAHDDTKHITQEYTTQEADILDQMYTQLAQEYPKSAAIKRMPLNFLTGDAFRHRLSQHLEHGIRKGVPSLFREMRSLYSNTAKVAIIEQVIMSFIKELRENRRFNSNSTSTSTSESEYESPAALMFSLYFAGQHFDHLRQWSRALQCVNEAIEQTPTTMDLYVLKARIHKHAGDFDLAYRLMNFARLLDTQDRYLNTKCTRYAFRAHEPDDGENLVALFLREGGKNVAKALYSNQVMWYDIASADCFYEMGQLPMALKQYMNVQKHFNEFQEDTYDYHLYCMRKNTINSYLDMIKWVDTMRDHRYFGKGGRGIVQVSVVSSLYLSLCVCVCMCVCVCVCVCVCLSFFLSFFLSIIAVMNSILC